jgi:hypothetical protein
MRYEPGAEYTAWMDAYQQVYAAADNVRTVPCPHCGRTCLNLVYVVLRPDAEAGSAVFWCGNCLFGLPAFRALVPEGFPRQLSGTEHVPDYSYVLDDEPG